MSISFPRTFGPLTGAVPLSYLDDNFKQINSSIGTGANQLVQLSGSAKLPAVDGSQLTNLPIPTINTVSQVRQTVLTGSVNSSGVPNALVVGAGLNVDFSATATPMVLSFAAGFSSGGNTDTIEVLSVDATAIVTLPARNISYIYRDALTAWGSTLAPPLYGYYYDQKAQSCLSLNAVQTDDFGNTWTATALSYSNTSPAIAGTYMGVFNGTTSKMSATATPLGKKSWTMRCKFKPGAAALRPIFALINGGGYGVQAWITAANRLRLDLASVTASNDIASSTGAIATLNVGTNYDIEVCYDSVAGKYFAYVDGVQELAITSSSRVFGGTELYVGSNQTLFTNCSIQGFELLPYCVHPNGATFTPSTALADVTAAGYAADWFDINGMKMKAVSAASSVAGTNPTFSNKTRVYVGKGVTGAATVTSATTYAYQGRYDSGAVNVIPGAATAASITHNLGVTPSVLPTLYVKILSASTSNTPGDFVGNISAVPSGVGGAETPYTILYNDTTAGWCVGVGQSEIQNPTNGTLTNLTTTSGFWGMSVTRGW